MKFSHINSALSGAVFVLMLVMFPITSMAAQQPATQGQEQQQSKAADDDSAHHDARAWLARMVKSFNQPNYSLSLIQIQQQQYQPIMIERGKVDDQALIYVNYLNGPEREVLHRSDLVAYFQHDAAPYAVRGERPVDPLPASFTEGFDGLEKNYRFILGGRSRVMGRPAQLVRIEPRDDNRFSLWLWLDAEQGLLLRADTLGPNDNTLEHLQVMSMNFTRQPSPLIKRLASVPLPDTMPVIGDMPHQQTPLQWRCGWLPEGFHLIGHDRHTLGLTHQPINYQLYTDGLVNISVYINTHVDKQGSQVEGAQGATTFFTHADSGVEVAIIGNIPLPTARRIAEHIYPREEGQNGD